ncbi:hydrogen peroxide-inducible genes activator [Phenylobacterium immobile]|uniref:hydrogen peroxide-inducible genes activator n=1 Tax=Phenylobacterium immobile TaxID=21 RepID=UPI000A74F441|nr:hydrogen peroxide-inducible genes activator [Phenylobacterium immobile]
MNQNGMPTVRQLLYLIALGEQDSFTRAAAAVGVSQPSFSQQILHLEALLGGPVAERGRKAALTPLGREAVVVARRALAEVQAFTALAGGRGLTGMIRLGVSPTLGPYLLPRLVARLHSESPTLRLHVREGLPSMLTEELAEGAHDVVLLQLPVDEERFHVELLLRDAVHVAMAADDPLAGVEAIELEHLRGRGLLTLQPQYRMSIQVAALAEQAGAFVLGDYEGASLGAIRQMAGMGMGLALLPELYVRQEVRGTDDVVIKPFAGGRLFREVGLAWRRGAGRRPGFSALATMIRDAART